MSTFLKDKEWDQMDWLNRAVEPFTFSFNSYITKIPSTYDVSYYEIINMIKNGREIRLAEVAKQLVVRSEIDKHGISVLEMIGYENIFTFDLEPDTEIDLESGVIKGKLSLVKKMESMNDDSIKELMPQLVINNFRVSSSRSQASHVNEVMDILECKTNRSSSSVRKKCSGLQTHLHEIYKENKWNIRNVDLAIKMLSWISSYCENGDRYSLANLSKLKCMTHNGHPIYSMEEIK